jgi:hypothetical protein
VFIDGVKSSNYAVRGRDEENCSLLVLCLMQMVTVHISLLFSHMVNGVSKVVL